MRFRFTLPAASFENALLFLGLFLFVVFQIFFSSLHVTLSGNRNLAAPPMMEDFIPRRANQTSAECVPFASQFSPTTEYQQSANLPQWMKDYFDWHREQTSTINSCNVKDFKFLVLRCSDEDNRCGGVADRLKSIPFFLASAKQSNRIFLIRWQRPTKLEEFLLPNEINWSFPDWMYGFLENGEGNLPTANKIVWALEHDPHRVFVEGFTQDTYGGSAIYYRMDRELDEHKPFNATNNEKASAGWSDYQIIFRDLFYTLFQPSPAVERIIREKMESANLVPGKFSTSHYRAFYAVEHEKKVRSEAELTEKTRNALNCASELQPGDPIYFASDSQIAVQFARSMPQNKNIVTFDHKQEALHLDKKEQWTSGNVSDFYPTFVDLLIMAEAKCASYGMGGYGTFANMLSQDPNCTNQHDSLDVNLREYCEWKDSKDDIAPW